MELCDEGHDEICYDGRGCPVCEVSQKIEELKNELEPTLEKIKEQVQKQRERLDVAKENGMAVSDVFIDGTTCQLEYAVGELEKLSQSIG